MLLNIRRRCGKTFVGTKLSLNSYLYHIPFEVNHLSWHEREVVLQTETLRMGKHYHTNSKREHHLSSKIIPVNFKKSGNQPFSPE